MKIWKILTTHFADKLKMINQSVDKSVTMSIATSIMHCPNLGRTYWRIPRVAVQAAGKAQPTKEYAKNFELSVVARGLSDLVGGWWCYIGGCLLVMGMRIFRKDTKRGNGLKKCIWVAKCLAPQNHHHSNFKWAHFGNLRGVGKYLVKVQPRSKLMMVVQENIPIDEK